MSIIYSDKDGYFISHQLFILKLYDTILNKTENTIHFYEHFFHIHNSFVRDKQLFQSDAKNDCVKQLNRKRKLPKIEVFYILNLEQSNFLNIMF